MSDPRTLRILSFDGGGERGYMSIYWFQKFVQLWGVDPETLSQKFDVICGTSVGGIIGLSLAFGVTPEEIMPFFTEQGPYIFSLTSLTPSVRPNAAAKVALILTDTPFYQSSGPTASEYGAGLLAATLQTQFGTNTMQDLRTNVIIPSYQYDTDTYILFSNLNYPDFIGQDELISNVALCTSAAPVYLPSIVLPDGHTYIDGAVYMNNPADFGRVLAGMVKPTANRTCILSIGTGIGELGFDPGDPSVVDERVNSLVSTLGTAAPMAFDSIATIFALYDMCSTGGQESINKSLYLESTYTLSQLYYYRFQPQLDPELNTEIDNTDPEILQYYRDTATTSFNDDIDNITTFIGHLTA